MRRLTPLFFVVTLLALLAGCGSSDVPTSHPTKGVAQKVRTAWLKEPSCKPPKGASRWGCSAGSYRCQGVVTDRGWSISCSKPGRAIFFRIQPK